MLFNIVGKIRMKYIIPLIILIIFTGCSLLDFGSKLNTKALRIPPHAAFLMSASSGYITVVDTKGDSVIGREEVARRDNFKLEQIDDFLVYKGLLYVTLSDKNAKNPNDGSDVLRILNPSTGQIEESKVGWAPDKIYTIGNNMAFVSTNLFYYSNDSCYNYIYNLDTKKVIDTIAFQKPDLVDFVVSNGDTVIMGVEQSYAPQYFVLYSKKTKSIIASHIPLINNDGSNVAIISGNNLYACCSRKVVVFSLSDLSLKNTINLPDGDHFPQSMVIARDKLYITYFDVNGYKKIDVIDTNTNEWIKSIDVPKGGAECLDYSESLDKIFAASYLYGKIYVIDPFTDSITDTIKTGDSTSTYSVIHVEDE